MGGTSIVTMVCTIVTVTFTDPTTNTTRVERDIGECASYRGVPVVSWSNIFREISKAKACGVRPFTMKGQCNG